jgi:transcriptional regulator with XRE-family HTH domain
MVDSPEKVLYFLQDMPTLDDELRRQIRDQLQDRKSAGMAVADMAAKLDVKPATVYQLLGGETTPTAKVLCNSCRNLKMSFQVDGHRIGATDFPPKAQQPPATEVQLGLFDLTASSIGGELNVTIKKLPNLAIALAVRVAG